MSSCKYYLAILLALLACAAQADDSITGNTLQITTRLHSFVGRPIWTLIIRDVDTGTVYPYRYDFTSANHFWLAFTYGRNFLITASRLQIDTYQADCNKFHQYRINNFCHLESKGRIVRNHNLYISLSGVLSPHQQDYQCQVTITP